MSIPFAGSVLPYYQRFVLVFGPEATALGEPAFGPPVRLRPGYRLFYEPGYVLPVDAIDDLGNRISPPDVYAWIEAHGDAFPRADVIGVRSGGEQATFFMKELDLAQLAVFADFGADAPPVHLSLAIEARAVEDGLALAPTACPPELAMWARALPWYRLAPGVFGALGAAILQQLLVSGRRDWRLTFDQLDDLIEW